MGRPSKLGTLDYPGRTSTPVLPEMLTAKQAARLLGCTVRSLHDARRAGRLAAVPHGERGWRFRREALERLGTMPADLERYVNERIALALETAVQAVTAQLRGEMPAVREEHP